jgi:hypothetical protein
MLEYDGGGTAGYRYGCRDTCAPRTRIVADRRVLSGLSPIMSALVVARRQSSPVVPVATPLWPPDGSGGVLAGRRPSPRRPPASRLLNPAHDG